MDGVIAEEISNRRLPGAVVLVARKGRIVVEVWNARVRRGCRGRRPSSASRRSYENDTTALPRSSNSREIVYPRESVAESSPITSVIKITSSNVNPSDDFRDIR
jgi:hypothetical protein